MDTVTFTFASFLRMGPTKPSFSRALSMASSGVSASTSTTSHVLLPNPSSFVYSTVALHFAIFIP